MRELSYLAGGNPPKNPGIYERPPGGNWTPVTFWPAWIAPTQERVDNICRLIEAGREFDSHTEIEAELIEAGLLPPAWEDA